MKSIACALLVWRLIWITSEELSSFSLIQLSQILPLQGPVPVYLLFITDCNHLAPNDYSIRKIIRLNSSSVQKSIRTGCVCIKTSLYSLYKHANLPKTSKRQVLAIVWTRKSDSPALFCLTPFSELLLSFSARHLCSWYIFFQGT